MRTSKAASISKPAAASSTKTITTSTQALDKQKSIQLQYYKAQEPIRPVCIKGPESTVEIDARASAGNAEVESRFREQMKKEKAEAFLLMIQQKAATIEKENQERRAEEKLKKKRDEESRMTAMSSVLQYYPKKSSTVSKSKKMEAGKTSEICKAFLGDKTEKILNRDCKSINSAKELREEEDRRIDREGEIADDDNAEVIIAHQHSKDTCINNEEVLEGDEEERNPVEILDAAEAVRRLERIRERLYICGKNLV